MKVIFVLFLFYITFSFCQWDYGAFIGTNTEKQNLAVWNSLDNSSFTEICDGLFGVERFSPAYTTDISSRIFIYVHDDGLYDYATHTPLYYNETSNSIECGEPTHGCIAQWYTNQTSRIFHDPLLNQTIMVDLLFTSDKQGEYYHTRVWKYSVPDCVLLFVDSFKMSPVLASEELSVMYDYSNHRLYFLYDALEIYSRHRIRGIDIRYPSLLFDFILPLQHFNDLVFAQFDPSSGNILLIAGHRNFSTPLQTFIFNPIHLNTFSPSNWTIKDHQIGPGSQNTAVNWRQDLFVSQIYTNEIEGYYQYAWKVLSGEYVTVIGLPEEIDNGWFYDPLLQITPVNINTASESELETLPGITSDIAEDIIKIRNRDGPFASVDSLFTEILEISYELYRSMRPYAAI